ncbi:MAG: PQQ-binding-like beta-propeller repeat protein [Planctomycetota bacterium]
MNISILFLLVALWTPQESDTHSWSDSTGKFSVDATMLVQASDKLEADVVLTKSDGKTITVAFDKLGKSSQRLAQRLRRNARKERDAMKEQNEPASAESEKKTTANGTSKDSPAVQTWNWRGPNRDGISEETDLIDDWSTKPQLVWTARGLGNGMSSVAVSGNLIFTLGNINGNESLIALDRESGREVWTTRIGDGGESNSTPTVDDDLVFALGLAGDLVCVETKTGKEVWRKNYERDFGGKMMSQWGYSESPLIDGDRLICTPGGPNAMIVALDRKTGDTIWKTPMRPGGGRGTDGAGYSSIVISNGGGVKQYLTIVGRGLISVSAKDGRPLWKYERIANVTANVPTPIVDGNFVFCSTGYDDGGTALLKLGKQNGSIGFQEIYYLSANQLQNHHGGMIKIGDYVYMGEGHNQGFPACIEFKSGRMMWPKNRGAGTGSAAIVAADGHLYFRYENGVMALVEADPQQYRLKGKFKIATNFKQSWPHPVIFAGKLFLRDQDQLHCYDIEAK